MNLTKRTRTPRAALAVKAVRDARQRIRTRAEFVRIVAAQLNTIAPGTVRVRTLPVTSAGRRRQWVTLDDVAGRPVEADADDHAAALGLLKRAFPAADWSVPRVYDAATGDLTTDVPPAPAALGIDTAPPADEDDPYWDMTSADTFTSDELYAMDLADELSMDAADEARYAAEENDL